MGGAVGPATNGPVVGQTKLLSRANVRPLWYAAIAVCGAVLYGYDGTYFTAILEMNKFKEDYGSAIIDGKINITSAQKSILASAVQIGEFVGSLSAAFIGDFSGRRGGFFAACFFVALGVIIQVIPAGSVPALGVGRAVLGMGVGVISNCTPLYLAEVSPTAIRGAVVSSWQLLLAIGQVIGACVGQGTHAMTTTWAYRIPMILNLAIVAVIVAGMFVIPESPRWLVSKDRDDEALAALRKINAGQEDPERVAAAEMRSFTQARQDEREAKGESGWSTMLRGVERRKLLCVVGILGAQQIGGVQFIFSYTTTFFAAVDLNDAFLVTIIVDIIEVVGVLVSFLLVNRFGRRPLLLLTSVPMFISLFVMAALGTIDGPTTTQKRTIAGMLCVFVFFFNLAWGPLAWTVASELATGINRQKIMALGTALFWIIAFLVTFTLPYLFDKDQANLGPQIGWIYGVGTFIAMAFVYFVIPETRGRTLEEINEMLEERLPPRKWKGHITRVSQAAHEDSPVQSSYEQDGDEELKKKAPESPTAVTVDAE
ncbi:unnamed protein product [Parajaminaea phylloscopi]